LKIIENHIISATRQELWNVYLKNESIFELYSFEEYLFHMRLKGVRIIDDKERTSNETN
jgi:hypothetical protein